MEIRLQVAGYPDSDVEELAELAWSLQEELLECDVEDVGRPSAAPVEGAKGDALEWAQLVVTVVGTLPPVVAALRSWLGRHRGASITVEIDGDRVTVADPSASERQDLLQTWMQRHGRG